MRPRIYLRLWIPLIAVMVTLASTGCSRRSPDAVFLIVVDTLRPDRLSSYGGRMFATPFTDTLATEGVLFENAFSVASWTVPGMGAMMTSLYPTQLGLVETPVDDGQITKWRQRREQNAHTLSLEERTLSEIMHDAGFTTAAFVNQPGLIAGDGFTQGFDEFYYPRDVETIVRLDSGEVVGYHKWPPFLQNAREIDNLIATEFDRWLSTRADGKVFVWIHLLTPHRPYLPPPWTQRRTAASKQRFADPDMSDAYDGEVIAADEIVGLILDSIDRYVGEDNSVVVFASDHGEAFGEHGMFEHGHTLHGEVTRVPLIVRAPRAPAGVRVSDYVRTIDILPTITDLADVSSRVPDDIEGETLAPLFSGGGGNREVYCEAMLYGPTERSLIVDGKRILWHGESDTAQLFNCYLDPQETINVKATFPTLADSLRDRMTALHERLVADYERRVGGGTTADRREEFQKALESLGYLEGVNDSVPLPPPPPRDPHEGHDH